MQTRFTRELQLKHQYSKYFFQHKFVQLNNKCKFVQLQNRFLNSNISNTNLCSFKLDFSIQIFSFSIT